jgi:hypothetical protein
MCARRVAPRRASRSSAMSAGSGASNRSAARHRMREAQRRGVQRLAREGRDGAAPPGRQRLRRHLAAPAIDRIADQPVADMGHVHPDLVRAPGLQPAFDQRAGGGAPKLPAPAPASPRAARGRQHRLALPVGAVAGELRRRCAPPRLSRDARTPRSRGSAGIGHAVAQRQIAPLDLCASNCAASP